MRRDGKSHDQTAIPKFVAFQSDIMDILKQSKVKRCKESITKTYLYNFDPLKPHFYIVKLGFTGVYIIFLISAQNIDCGYSLEPPRRGGSNEYPQSMFWAEIWKKILEFLSDNFQFLVVKFSVHLNRCVFVMVWNVTKIISEHNNRCTVKKFIFACSFIYVFFFFFFILVKII